jgi:hypothetical protein
MLWGSHRLSSSTVSFSSSYDLKKDWRNSIEMEQHVFLLILRCSIVGLAPGLAHKHKTRLERLAMDKHSTLLRTLVNYDHECLMTLGTCYTKGLKTKQHFDRSRSTSRGTR